MEEKAAMASWSQAFCFHVTIQTLNAMCGEVFGTARRTSSQTTLTHLEHRGQGQGQGRIMSPLNNLIYILTSLAFYHQVRHLTPLGSLDSGELLSTWL